MPNSLSLNATQTKKNKGKVVLFFPHFGPDSQDHHWFPFPYLYLAPFLEKAGYTVKIVDARVEDDWKNILTKELKDAFALGITSMSGPDLLPAIEASKIAKGMSKKVNIVWGGSHASALPDEIFEAGVTDYVLLGPAEFSFPKLLDAVYLKEEIPSDVKGILYERNGKVVGNRNVNSPVFHYEDAPAYHLLDIEKYRSKNNVVSYFKTRGCPFKCTFCATGHFDVSHKLVPQYHREIRYLLQDLKFGALCFRDPTFFLKASTVMDVSDLMLSIGNVRWKGQARGTFHRQYTDEQMKHMRKSGLTSVMFGVESGAQRMLDLMIKKVKREDYIKSAEVLHDLGIEMVASFMFAMPRETTEDLKETISLMRILKKKNPNIFLQNCIFLPLPSTNMFRDAVKLGYKPPTTLHGWATRSSFPVFEKRKDITWMKKSELEEYTKIYNDEFGEAKDPFQLERTGEYVNPMHGT
tara:strand:+ start:427 stop:1824 length:1398 start_codon:yes stop_codon:yes gene_type:complete